MEYLAAFLYLFDKICFTFTRRAFKIEDTK